MDSLPPGKIFGMTVTEPRTEFTGSSLTDAKASDDSNKKLDSSSVSSTSKSPLVSQNAIEMLSSLFPHRKRSVLELVLRRCDLDLLRWERVYYFFWSVNRIVNEIRRAIEQCSKTQPPPHSNTSRASPVSSPEIIQSAFRPISHSASAATSIAPTLHQLSAIPTQNPSSYTSLIAYPNKWFLPIPVTMSHHHLTNFPRCNMVNCTLCLHHPAGI